MADGSADPAGVASAGREDGLDRGPWLQRLRGRGCGLTFDEVDEGVNVERFAKIGIEALLQERLAVGVGQLPADGDQARRLNPGQGADESDNGRRRRVGEVDVRD